MAEEAAAASRAHPDPPPAHAMVHDIGHGEPVSIFETHLKTILLIFKEKLSIIDLMHNDGQTCKATVYYLKIISSPSLVIKFIKLLFIHSDRFSN